MGLFPRHGILLEFEGGNHFNSVPIQWKSWLTIHSYAVSTWLELSHPSVPEDSIVHFDMTRQHECHAISLSSQTLDQFWLYYESMANLGKEPLASFSLFIITTLPIVTTRSLCETPQPSSGFEMGDVAKAAKLYNFNLCEWIFFPLG